jgi:branched-chain amino acid transport system substrate-binding protein
MKYLYMALSYLIVIFTPNSVLSQEPIIIGLDADMSAVAAEGGIAIQRGAELAIEELNAAGGVLGRKLTLDVRDHRGNPARGLANINYFAKQDNVVAVLGGVHTPVALHELPAIHKHKMIYLGPWAAGTPVVDNGYTPNYVFRLSVRDQHAGFVLLNHAKQRKLVKAGLLLERTGWGRSNEKSMKAAAKKLDLSVVGTEWFNWREVSMKNQVDNLISAGADVILLVANAPEGAAVIKEMATRDSSKKVPILSHWGIAGGAFVKKAGLDNIAAVDLSVLQTYSFLQPSDKEKRDDLLAAYQKKYGQDYTAESIPAAVGVVHAYDLIHLLVKAIENALSTDREKVHKSLENIEIYNGVFKEFNPPFSKARHDALSQDDYIITKFNKKGFLVPVDR